MHGELAQTIVAHARHQVIREYVEFLDEIPKTKTEKIQRHKLRYLTEQVSDMTARGAN